MMVSVAAMLVLCSMALAQEGGPAQASTNPGKHVIFPAQNQTAEQQEQDQLAAYDWRRSNPAGIPIWRPISK
jgi:hypothetical protein